MAILSRTALIASDIVVLLVTWWQLCVTARSSGQRWTQSALVVLLLRDSTLYFILFLLLNVAQIVTQLMLGNAFNPLPSFIYPFTTIVISRLLLNFRRLSYRRQMPMHSGSNIAPPTVEEPGFFYRSFLSTIVFRPHSFTQHNNPNQIPSASPIVPASILEDTLESGHAHVAKCGRIDEVSDKDENMIADEG
ncbi:hypothetical protein DAEQUDRAFT_175152 [Daedalea quercina L-15889]|uniref:Transmembrane protein n=1 Tax=Daedalea quercina L-15889 TaxID=1314783 RepID=A0A165RCJ7_9APHY|nr:hypothetical protein DAEQUDRAFT_175152 [Daedalea quercina L-15889]